MKTSRIHSTLLRVVMLFGLALSCFCMFARAEERVLQPNKPPSQPDSAEKYKQEVLEDIYDNLRMSEPQEIEKSLGLKQVFTEGHAKYYLGQKLLEDLDIKDLEGLQKKAEQMTTNLNNAEQQVQTERRRDIQDMMDARRLADENNNRWRR